MTTRDPQAIYDQIQRNIEREMAQLPPLPKGMARNPAHIRALIARLRLTNGRLWRELGR